MDAKQQAEIYRRAAQVIAAMDPRTQWRLPPGVSSGPVGRSYSQAESAIWDGYSGAASVLYRIAAEFDKDAEEAA